MKRLIQGILNTIGKPAEQMSPIREPDLELVASVAFEPLYGETRDRGTPQGGR